VILTRVRFFARRNAAIRFWAPASSGRSSTCPPASSAGYRLVTVRSKEIEECTGTEPPAATP